MDQRFFGGPATSDNLRIEARDIEIGAPDGRGYASVLREYADVLDAATAFSAAVCEMFRDDANWSVLDLDGASEFFNRIGFAPPAEAASTEVICNRCGDRMNEADSPDGEMCPDCHDHAQYEENE